MSELWRDWSDGKGTVRLDDAERCLGDWSRPPGDWKSIGEALLGRVRAAEARMEELEKQVMECPTCEGTGFMDAVVGWKTPEGEEILNTEMCAECRGTTISSWGQAIREAEAAEARVEGHLETIRHLVSRCEATEACAEQDFEGYNRHVDALREERDRLKARICRLESDVEDLQDPEDTIGRIWQERAEAAEARVAETQSQLAAALAVPDDKFIACPKCGAGNRENSGYCCRMCGASLGDTSIVACPVTRAEAAEARVERLRAVVQGALNGDGLDGCTCGEPSTLCPRCRALDALEPGDLD